MSKKHNKSVTKKSVLVDVIIPVFRRIDLLEKCLDSIPEAFDDISYQVILWDNGTPKEEKDALYSKLYSNPTYRIIENKTNIGFPKACNKAANYGTAPFIFLLNSDVILSPGSFKILFNEFNTPEGNVGVAGMKLLFPDDCEDLNPKIRPSGKVQHIGLSSNIKGEIVHSLIGWSSDNPKVNRIKYVLGVTGAAFLTKRDVWNKVGGMGEEYGLGTFEDIDYCMKAHLLNLYSIVVPQAVGVHYTGATVEKYKIAYPLGQNHTIFKQRWLSKLVWTDWETW